MIVNNVPAAESFAAAADSREKKLATLDKEFQALTQEIDQLNAQLDMLMKDPNAETKNMEALATQLDQALAKKNDLEKEKEIKTLEKELSPLLVNPEIHQDRILAINERLAQLKKASKSSNINDQEILPFEISSDYLTHFQKARQKRKTESQTYKPTQKELLTTQLEKSNRRLEELRKILKMQEDFIKQGDRIRAEEKRQELIERLKQEIETVMKEHNTIEGRLQRWFLQRWSILEPLWFSTDNLLLHLPSKIYQLPDQEKDDIDEEIDFL